MLLAGMRCTRPKSVTTYSACAPGAEPITRSPGLMPSTSLPTASTSPAHSSPIRAPFPPTATVLVAGGDQQVGPIERGGADPDQHLVGLGHRLRHVADLDAGITENRSFHEVFR